MNNTHLTEKKFADFDIAPETRNPIRDLASLLNNISPARLFDEVLKLLLSGCAFETFQKLLSFQLFDPLFPQVSQVLRQDPRSNYYKAFIDQGLKNILFVSEQMFVSRASNISFNFSLNSSNILE